MMCRPVSKRSNNNDFDSQYDIKLKKFLDYYKNQGVLLSDGDKQKLSNFLKIELPVCFWITSSENNTNSILSEFNSINNSKHSDSRFNKIKWNQNNVFNPTFKCEASKKDLKRREENQIMHDWLSRECDAGTIVRQEEVSMIPPIVLEIEKGHSVLDMCAAPGSKTCQMAEILKKKEFGMPENQRGYVLAADSSFPRCHVLAKRVKELCLPNIAVINENAQWLPSRLSSFDRVLCDVPCSGDGTIRKSPCQNIKKWEPGRGVSLHRLQLVLAKKGASMLKPGGVMVYSTCSLNPLENEAVVSGLIQSSQGELEVVNASQSLNGLITRNGVTRWKVPFKNRLFESSVELKEFVETDRTKNSKGNNILPSCFCPSFDETSRDLERQLKNCFRVLPHDQNSGGFFVAKIQKKRMLL